MTSPSDESGGVPAAIPPLIPTSTPPEERGAKPLRVLYCHCTYANVVPKATKEEVLRRLTESGIPFDAVPDLCEMSAMKDPCLAELAGDGYLRIVACYPRAVKWLFHAAGVKLPDSAEVLNMRTDTADAVVKQLVSPSPLTPHPPRGEGN
jgi:hypothetical protein